MTTLLRDHRLLAVLTPAERAVVEGLCEPVAYAAGEDLVTPGEDAPGLHLLLSGHVEVVVEVDGLQHEVAVLGPDAVVGELSLLEHRGRVAARIRALSDVEAAVVPAAHADELLAVDAVALQLDALARSRRATNRALRAAPVAAGSVDGRPLTLRPLWPEDWRQFAANRDRVSDESLRMRFFHVPRLTEQTFRRLTATDHKDQFAWGAVLDGAVVGVGRHALQAEDRGVAELALLVADDVQGHGIGGRLVAAIVAAVDAHGARELTALARADNAAVQALLGRYGASWQSEGDDVVTARWPVATALAAVEDRALVAAARAVAAEVLGDVVDR